MTTQSDPLTRPADRVQAAGQPVSLIPSATVALLAGAALAAGCQISQVGALVAIGAVQLALVLGWVLATGLPGRIGAIVLGCAASGGADYSATRWYEHGYEASLAVLGVALALMFAHQLVRGVVRARVVESLSGVAFIVIAGCAVTGLLLLRRQGDGPQEAAGIAAAAGVALFLGQLVDAIISRPRFDPDIGRGLCGMAAGVAAGCGAGYAVMRSVSELTPTRAGIAAAGVSVVACLLSVGTSFAAAGGVDARPPSPPELHPTELHPTELHPTELHPTELHPTDLHPADPDLERRLAGSVGSLGLRPVAAAMAVLCLTIPAGYVLISGLST